MLLVPLVHDFCTSLSEVATFVTCVAICSSFLSTHSKNGTPVVNQLSVNASIDVDEGYVPGVGGGNFLVMG